MLVLKEFNSSQSVTIVFEFGLLDIEISLPQLGSVHVKEIPNTGFLVSAQFGESANFEIYDVTRKGQAKKVYSFTEVPGGTIFSLTTLNARIYTPFF